MSEYVSSGREGTVDCGISHKKLVQPETGAFFANPNHVRA